MFRFVLSIIVASLAAAPAIGDSIRQTLLEVDLELVLAADASGSVPSILLHAQKQGFAEAFRDPDLQDALFSGPLGRVAVVYFEWAGPGQQRLVVPWTVLTNAEDIAAFATRLEDAPDGAVGGETSISGAMLYAEYLIATNYFDGLRKVVDIASNGANSAGPPLDVALERLRASGAIVNALLLPQPGPDSRDPYKALFTGSDVPLDEYFQAEVIGGPGSFVLNVELEAGFVEAILRKLIVEVAWSMQ
jgi:hypothetical protein